MLYCANAQPAISYYLLKVLTLCFATYHLGVCAYKQIVPFLILHHL